MLDLGTPCVATDLHDAAAAREAIEVACSFVEQVDGASAVVEPQGLELALQGKELAHGFE